jgi:hypothetical protein
MKPGDLLVLKGYSRYSGLDMSNSYFINILNGAIGVYVGHFEEHEQKAYDVVLTGGNLVKCAPKVWSTFDETR